MGGLSTPKYKKGHAYYGTILLILMPSLLILMLILLLLMPGPANAWSDCLLQNIEPQGVPEALGGTTRQQVEFYMHRFASAGIAKRNQFCFLLV